MPTALASGQFMIGALVPHGITSFCRMAEGEVSVMWAVCVQVPL